MNRTLANVTRFPSGLAGQSRPIHWRQVGVSEQDLGRTFQDVMAEMDHHYAEGTWADVFRLMTSDGCKYYVGCGENFEIALGYQWDGDRDKFQVRSVGFRGGIQPHEALHLIALHVRSFIRENELNHVYTIIPLTMDNPRIVQLHGLIPWLPDWKITGGHHVVGGTYWRLEPLSLGGEGC